MEGIKKRLSRNLLIGIFVLVGFVLSFSVARAATLYLAPSSGTYNVGSNFSVIIKTNTAGASINASEGTLVFNPNELSVISLSKSGSIFNLWVQEPEFSNALGTVNFSGIILNPGFNGASGTLLTVNVKAKSPGSTQMVLSSGAVLANDGNGTNVLSALNGGSYTLRVTSAVPQVAPETAPTPAQPSSSANFGGGLTITSPTHPDSSKWYSNSSPLFKWDISSGVREVIMVLSKRANSPPIVSYKPPISEKTLTDLEDGGWYLNGRFRTSAGLGPVTSFRFNIDTKPPADFNITRLDTNDTTNPRPQLLFQSSDAASGIDKYQIKVGDSGWLDIDPNLAGRAYAIPLQKYGAYPVEIKAVDRAGNSSSAKTEIKIEPIKSSIVIKEITKEVDKGAPIIVKGTSEPTGQVIIEVARNGSDMLSLISNAYAQQADKNHWTYETVANQNGDWSIEITDLPTGNYKVATRSQDERGAISKLSNIVETRVRGGILDFIFKMFDWIVNLLSRGGLFIAFLVALAGLILALIEFFKAKSKKWFKSFIDLAIVKRTQKKSHKQVEHIINDMEKEIQFLYLISKRRRLGPEESYLKNKMTQYLKALKNLDDIEDKS